MAKSPQILTVSELNKATRQLIESAFSVIYVTGEISNLAKPSSGHLYFTLKDANAQVRCALFRSYNNLSACTPKEGMQVIVRAKASLFENRGDFQLLVENIEEAGDGALKRAFEKVKAELAKEGLFLQEHKKPLPELPKCIGVITSPTGAAIQDIRHVLQRRFPLIPVILYPTAVQGEAAIPQIITMLKVANERRECDVLILARGGGSLEDLAPFNDEKVARTVFASRIPVVTGIGHEIDFTIADFVADCRAPTPSAAAELVTPSQDHFEVLLAKQRMQILRKMKEILSQKSQQLFHLEKRLTHPGQKIFQAMQLLDQLERRLILGIKAFYTQKIHAVESLEARIKLHNPQLRMASLYKEIESLKSHLKTLLFHHFETCQAKLANTVRALETVSPLATLARGYAIVTDKKNQILINTESICIDDQLNIQLARGKIECLVVGKE